MPNFDIENSFDGIVAGIDEVGRGPWAGPVVAAAAVLDVSKIPENLLSMIDDSKKLTLSMRENVFDSFMELSVGFQFSIGQASVEEIDALNILQATLLAMERAFEKLQNDVGNKIQYALVDGNKAPNIPCETHTVIKGDAQSFSIAAASIMAKVTRDRMMVKLAKEFPHYGWERNAGYGTKVHQEGLAQHGITPHHRKSYKPIQKFMA